MANRKCYNSDYPVHGDNREGINSETKNVSGIPYKLVFGHNKYMYAHYFTAWEKNTANFFLLHFPKRTHVLMGV